jgi:hypothetical protein
MTRKQFLILVAALAAIAAVGAWIMQSQRTAWAPADSRIGQRLVAGLKLEDVAEVVLRDASATLTLVRRDGTWVVRERADFPADAERVRELLLKLPELKIVQAERWREAQRVWNWQNRAGQPGKPARHDLELRTAQEDDDPAAAHKKVTAEQPPRSVRRAGRADRPLRHAGNGNEKRSACFRSAGNRRSKA